MFKTSPAPIPNTGRPQTRLDAPRPSADLVVTMKNLLACLAAFAAFSVSAQGMYTYPQWNPDANYSGFIETGDLLALLTVFSEPWGFNDTASCDYDGTQFEHFIADVIAEDIVLDSISIQFILSDSTEPFYAPGCPDPFIDSVDTFYSFMLHRQSNLLYEGDGFRFKMIFESCCGNYNFRLGWMTGGSSGLQGLVEEGLYGDLPHYQSNYEFVARPHVEQYVQLPFETSFNGSIDSTGIEFLPFGSADWYLQKYGWGEGNTATLTSVYSDCWADYITHWNMIPFWHYAE